MAALPNPKTMAAISARIEAFKARGQSAPEVDQEPPKPVQTEAGPGLMRCALHGVYRRRVEFGKPAPCYACVDDRRQFRSPEEAASRAAERVEDRMDRIGLVGRYRSATFDTFLAETDAQRAALQACRAFAEGLPGSAPPWLIGPCGTGKSHLLAAIAHHMAFSRALSPKITTPRAIVRRLRATWAKGAEETEDDVRNAVALDPDLLLLDEAGLGFGTDAELVQLYDVIGERYDYAKPTVLASNLSVAELRAALGDRIFDRLREGARVVALDGPSFRGRSAARHDPGGASSLPQPSRHDRP